ncbi:MAG: hypothetical protein U9R43_14920, partial [Thermodesulfobacteriota bacterium]|nr:hypothetical protein [Thermodesulfobacteriota bacterium]
TIPPEPDRFTTMLEVAKFKSIVTFEQNFNEIDSSLYGSVRESFLIDKSNLPCIENEEAKWCANSKKPKDWILLKKPENSTIDYDFYSYSVPVCVDGILVAGTPGRASCQKEARMRLGNRNSNIHSNGPALIDAREEMKPELTPGRVPPDRFGSNMPPGWKRLNDKFRIGLGRLWEQIAKYLGKGLDNHKFWQLVAIHRIWVICIPYQSLWDFITISLIDKKGKTLWRKVRDIGELSIKHNENESFELYDISGNLIGPDLKLKNWESEGKEHPNIGWQMNLLTFLMSTLSIRDNKIILLPSLRLDKNDVLAQYAKSDHHFGISRVLIDYAGIASDALTVETPYPTANRHHPLVKLYHEAQYNSELSDLEEFAAAFVPCISDTVSSKKGSTSINNPGYWQKRVAHLYFSVNWERYDSSLKPSYKIWTKDEWVNFGENDFIKWRDCPARIE